MRCDELRVFEAKPGERARSTNVGRRRARVGDGPGGEVKWSSEAAGPSGRERRERLE
jgi:hypothetical protein